MKNFHDGQRRNLFTTEMKPTRKNQAEENPAEERMPKRTPQTVSLIKQEIILLNKQQKERLKSDAEKFAHEVGRAAAELFQPEKNDAPPCEGNNAEDILAAIYNSIEAGEIYVSHANRIRRELERPLRQRNDQLRKETL